MGRTNSCTSARPVPPSSVLTARWAAAASRDSSPCSSAIPCCTAYASMRSMATCNAATGLESGSTTPLALSICSRRCFGSPPAKTKTYSGATASVMSSDGPNCSAASPDRSIAIVCRFAAPTLPELNVTPTSAGSDDFFSRSCFTRCSRAMPSFTRRPVVNGGTGFSLFAALVSTVIATSIAPAESIAENTSRSRFTSIFVSESSSVGRALSMAVRMRGRHATGIFWAT